MPDLTPRLSRRRFLRGVALGLAAAGPAAGCTSGRGFSVFGYQLGTEPLYDESVRSVYVPLFQNRVFQTTPYRNAEVELTRAVVREIGTRTPFRVVSDPSRADTELRGCLVGITKTIANRNQQNQTREAELVFTVDVVWLDRRTGEALSNPRQKAKGPGQTDRPVIAPQDVPVFDPSLPPVVAFEDYPVAFPVRLTGRGRVLPELGESNATGEQMAINEAARQIVKMMEKPW